MSNDARRQYEAIQRAVRAADGVIADAGEQVLAAWNRIATGDVPVTQAQRTQFMRDVDVIIAATFVSGIGNVSLSPLYQIIKQESGRLFVAQMKVGLDELDDIMRRYDWWPAQRQYLIDASMTVTQRDRMARAYKIVYGPHVDQQRLLNARLFDRQRTWIDPKGYRLSGRIWKQGQAYRTAIDRTIQRGIQQGWSAERLAKELQQFVDPAYAPVKYTKNGRVYRTGTTYRPNAASAARRLARTEITAAHRAAVIERARDVPGVLGVKWNLSISHPEFDVCDGLASDDLHGLGAGVYPVDDVPAIPHPQCMCSQSIAQKSRAETRREIVEKYRAEAFAEAGFSPETGWLY